MAEPKKQLKCDGICDDCQTPEVCAEEFCGQHSGNVANINALKERVGDLEDRSGQVDNLTGRVNMLINICIIIIAAIAGDFSYSFFTNRHFENEMSADRLEIKDSLHALDLKVMYKIEEMSERMSDEMSDMSESVESKIDDISKETDKRFDTLEQTLPVIQMQLKDLKEHSTGD